MAEREMPKKQNETETSIEQRHRGKVTTGNVKRSKASSGRKFANLFLDEDINSVKDYAVYELIIPEIKNGILDILSMLLTGKGNNRRSSRSDREDYTSYSRSSRSSSRNKYSEDRRRYRTSRDVDSIIFETRRDADNVLSELDYYARKFGQVSVSDFYDAAGISDDNYTNNDFGWTLDDIRNAYISHTRGGCIIVLPPAIQLKD